MAAPRKSVNLEIGIRIQQARNAAGMSQPELADQLGVTSQHLSAVETGRTGTSFEVVGSICKILSISADQIVIGPSYYSDRHDELIRLARTVPENHVDNVIGIVKHYLNGIDVAQTKE